MGQVCAICHSPHTDGVMLLCSSRACTKECPNLGYHMTCLAPPVTDAQLAPKQPGGRKPPWFCPRLGCPKAGLQSKARRVPYAAAVSQGPAGNPAAGRAEGQAASEAGAEGETAAGLRIKPHVGITSPAIRASLRLLTQRALAAANTTRAGAQINTCDSCSVRGEAADVLLTCQRCCTARHAVCAGLPKAQHVNDWFCGPNCPLLDPAKGAGPL